MQYSALRIADILNVATPIYPDALIDVLLTDSRSLTYPERTLFFALTTPSGDGHRYVAELYRRGVRNFVVRRRPDTADACYTDANFFVVPDVRAALQQLARSHSRKVPFTAGHRHNRQQRQDNIERMAPPPAFSLDSYRALSAFL